MALLLVHTQVQSMALQLVHTQVQSNGLANLHIGAINGLAIGTHRCNQWPCYFCTQAQVMALLFLHTGAINGLAIGTHRYISYPYMHIEASLPLKYYLHTHRYTCTHTQTNTHTYKHHKAHVSTHVCTCAHIHTYTYTYAHIHTWAKEALAMGVCSKVLKSLSGVSPRSCTSKHHSCLGFQKPTEIHFTCIHLPLAARPIYSTSGTDWKWYHTATILIPIDNLLFYLVRIIRYPVQK